MKLSGRQPRMLPDVMQAIVDLKEGNGSTQNKILDHVQTIIKTTKSGPKPRNITMQVRRALKHGVQNGLIKQRSGKYQLGIPPRDFALYKTFQSMGGWSCCSKCKRGKKKRRGKRRRRNIDRKSSDLSCSDNSIRGDGSLEPMDRGRRRRRRRRRRRGRRRRRDGSISKDSSATDQTNKTPKSSKELLRAQRTYDKENRDNPHDSEEPLKVEAARDSYVN